MPINGKKPKIGILRKIQMKDDELCVRFFGDLHHFRESTRIKYCHIGQYFSIKIDVRLFQAAHKFTIAHFVHASTSIDSGDPEAAEISLLGASITVGIC